MAITFTLNGTSATFDDDPETPLLWVLRESAGLTGTKYGCGAGACGACTVHVNGAPVRACVAPLQGVSGASVVTIEGLATHTDGVRPGGAATAIGSPGAAKASPGAGVASAATRSGTRARDLHVIQQAWIDVQVPQCGYCQSGMIMAAAALLRANPDPSDEEVDAAITNLCRCGTYPRVRRAIRSLAQGGRRT